jgi:hypothetical protein
VGQDARAVEVKRVASMIALAIAGWLGLALAAIFWTPI